MLQIVLHRDCHGQPLQIHNHLKQIWKNQYSVSKNYREGPAMTEIEPLHKSESAGHSLIYTEIRNIHTLSSIWPWVEWLYEKNQQISFFIMARATDSPWLNSSILFSSWILVNKSFGDANCWATLGKLSWLLSHENQGQSRIAWREVSKAALNLGRLESETIWQLLKLSQDGMISQHSMHAKFWIFYGRLYRRKELYLKKRLYYTYISRVYKCRPI